MKDSLLLFEMVHDRIIGLVMDDLNTLMDVRFVLPNINLFLERLLARELSLSSYLFFGALIENDLE